MLQFWKISTNALPRCAAAARSTDDARDQADVLLRHLQLRHERRQRGQDGVFAAARAPAHFLVGLVVLRGQLAVRCHASMIDAASSARPWATTVPAQSRRRT